MAGEGNGRASLRLTPDLSEAAIGPLWFLRVHQSSPGVPVLSLYSLRFVRIGHVSAAGNICEIPESPFSHTPEQAAGARFFRRADSVLVMSFVQIMAAGTYLRAHLVPRSSTL